jgi:uncharacterized delta-60 repeat protein
LPANGKEPVGFTASGSATPAIATAMVIQPDGKIVLAGYKGTTTVSTALARLNPNGGLDTAFGGNGDGRFSGLFLKPAGVLDVAQAVALQGDGKIVVFGQIANSGYVARFTALGVPDPTFGGDGTVLYPLVESGTVSFVAGAVTANGDILASGSYDAGTGDGPTLLNVLFDSTGEVVSAQNISSVSSLDKGALVMQPDGKAVIAVTGGSGNCNVVRDDVGASLSLDGGFGIGGIATFGWNLGGDNVDYCYALALQRDGKILMGGQARSDASGGTHASILRLLTGGTLDPEFGKKDFVFASGATGIHNIGTGILVQNDQRIVLAGTAGTADPALEPNDFAALRLLTDGSLDATFTASTPGSSLGKVVFGFETGPSGRRDYASSAGLQGNRIVMAGSRETSNAAQIDQFAIARLENDKLFADGFDP